MDRDYYHVLGVSRDSITVQIKRAFRELSHRLALEHVDEGEQRFLRIREAYDTLSDPLLRSDYNRQLRAAERSSQKPPGHPAMTRPIDLFQSFGTYRPSLDALHDLFIQSSSGLGVPKSQPVREVNLELVLSPAQVQAGGCVPIDIPLARICELCGGTGKTGFFDCDECSGIGMHWEITRVDVVLPRHVADDANIPVSLEHLGIRNLYLNVRIRVSSGFLEVQ